MKKISLLLLLVWITLPFSAEAASIYAVAQPEVQTQEVFPVEIFLDTEGQNINALEGTLELSQNISVEEVRFSGSIVSFWLDEPKKGRGSVISFSGLIPAGYQGSPEKTGKGNLFTLYVRSANPGVGAISFRDSIAYLNDGEGTAVNLSKSPIDFSVVPDGLSGAAPDRDSFPPDSFVPEIVSGEPFGLLGDVLVFSAIDKDSGIDRFEVGFSHLAYLPDSLIQYSVITSPYTLPDDARESYIFIKAIDRQGNERTVTIAPNGFGVSRLVTIFLPIVCILIVLCIFLVLRSRTKITVNRT